MLGKVGVGPALMVAASTTALLPRRLRRMLRRRLRIQPSESRERPLWLCLKYPNQPRSVGLSRAMIVQQAAAGRPRRFSPGSCL